MSTAAPFVPGPEHREVVFLTGSGLSARTGLGTFRGPEGLWALEPETEHTCAPIYQADRRTLLFRVVHHRRVGLRVEARDEAEALAVAEDALGFGWAKFAYGSWKNLMKVDAVLGRVVPQRFFYNVGVTGTKPLR